MSATSARDARTVLWFLGWTEPSPRQRPHGGHGVEGLANEGCARWRRLVMLFRVQLPLLHVGRDDVDPVPGRAYGDLVDAYVRGLLRHPTNRRTQIVRLQHLRSQARSWAKRLRSA